MWPGLKSRFAPSRGESQSGISRPACAGNSHRRRAGPGVSLCCWVRYGGFIGALSHGFCSRCNRLRLTADGKLKPCLASDEEVDVKQALRQGAGEEELKALFLRALDLKPSQHQLQQYEEHERIMCQIGGVNRLWS